MSKIKTIGFLSFYFFTVVLILSCGSNTAKGINKHSESYIRQRIDTIYKTVGKSNYDPINLNKSYCSQRYYDLMEKASDICDKTDDILYDYDFWVCGQDYSDDWSCRVAKVYEITDSTALVDLNIHNFGDTETTIALRFERDDWFIDDFSPSKDGNDDKKYLREIIRKGYNNHED